MKRFPHAVHSPTTCPSSSVENRRGAPHWRHGRARGAPASKRSLGRSPLSSRAASRFRTKTVVVSQSGQLASIVPPRPSRNVRGEPHSLHSGPSPAIFSPVASPSSDPAMAAKGGAPKRAATAVPSTNANSFAQVGQVPVLRRTSCSSSSIAAPQAGQEFAMVVRRWNAPTPHYILHPTMRVGGMLSRRRASRRTDGSTAGASVPGPSNLVDEVVSRSGEPCRESRYGDLAIAAEPWNGEGSEV